MTTISDIDFSQDKNYVRVLDHGFVGFVDSMGTDESIAQAARVSYGKGTKTVTEDRGLVRYLMRHKHTSPFEMVQVKLHLKLPIFVMRQLVRHRTSSLNEYSGRYSVMTDEFYVPELDVIQPQSASNNQGRAGSISVEDAETAQNMIAGHSRYSYQVYKNLLGDDSDEIFSEDFKGISRELARLALPVNVYTEVYWTQNLRNFFHMLKLRLDSHAQLEIRVYAEAIYNMLKERFPIACEAFEDYDRDAVELSSMEKSLLDNILLISNVQGISFKDAFNRILSTFPDETAMMESFRMSKREFYEFKTTWKL